MPTGRTTCQRRCINVAKTSCSSGHGLQDNIISSHWAQDFVATMNQRQWRWFNVATTSCAKWVSLYNISANRRHWTNVGPPSTTSAQHWTNIGSMSRVFWDIIRYKVRERTTVARRAWTGVTGVLLYNMISGAIISELVLFSRQESQPEHDVNPIVLQCWACLQPGTQHHSNIGLPLAWVIKDLLGIDHGSHRP